MLGFCVFAPMGDALAKLIGQSVPLGQMILIRFAVQAVVLIPLVLATGRIWRMSRRPELKMLLPQNFIYIKHRCYR